MARDYDTQLLESVTVRRRRLRDAFLYGRLRSRRTLDENLIKILVSICVAAVACAGCAGWSFIKQQRAVQQKQQSQLGLPAPAPSSTPSPADVGAETWGGKHVTVAMLAAALHHVGTPDDLYSLPGAHELTSPDHYFLARQGSHWTAGVAERSSDRTGPRFGTEDAACRWLYNELVFAEPAPVAIAARSAGRRADAVVREVDAVLHPVRPTPKPTPKPSGKKKPPTPKPPPTSVVITLSRGFVVDQYGPESGSYLFPYGNARQADPQRFQLIKPLRVSASESGGAVQLHVEDSLVPEHASLVTVRWLLHNGYLRRATGG
jgi:hypothetical protein